MNFVCPKCGLPLVENGISALCPKKHSFDRARAGYYNLLLSASGGTHGDNAQMVEARRAFLDTGAYKPLSDKVSELAAKYISGGAVLDIGCGEGYYTDSIYRALSLNKRYQKNVRNFYHLKEETSDNFDNSSGVSFCFQMTAFLASISY